MANVGACDEHQFFHQVFFAIVIHVDALGCELLKCAVDNLNAAFDYEPSRINFGLCLLHE